MAQLVERIDPVTDTIAIDICDLERALRDSANSLSLLLLLLLAVARRQKWDGRDCGLSQTAVTG